MWNFNSQISCRSREKNSQDGVESSRQDSGLIRVSLDGERLAGRRRAVREDQLVPALEELLQLRKHHLVEDGLLLARRRKDFVEREPVEEAPAVVHRVLVRHAVFGSVESDLEEMVLVVWLSCPKSKCVTFLEAH